MNIDLDIAFLNNILLQMETLDDEFGKVIARYEYPYVDGSDLEDMGQKAHTVRIRAYFWDNDIQSTYNDHIDLVAMLADRSEAELIHPKYGLLKGRVESVTVRHDDRLRTAEVDIAFIEQLRGSIEPVEFEDVSTAVEQAFTAGQVEQMEQFAADATAALGAEAGTILAQLLDPAQAVLGQFSGVSLKAYNWLKGIDATIRAAEAELVEVANPANGIVSTINYGLNLPGRLIGSIARCVERYATLYRATTTSPGRFADQLGQATLALESALGMTGQVRAAGALRCGLETADLYREDEQSRSALRRREQAATFDLLGNYRPEADTSQLLTVRDLEESLAAVRSQLQAALDLIRSLHSLNAMARSLLDHVNSVKLEREKIVTITVAGQLPLHLLCLRYGLNYNYAARIRSINPTLRNPSYTTGEVRIYAR